MTDALPLIKIKIPIWFGGFPHVGIKGKDLQTGKIPIIDSQMYRVRIEYERKSDGVRTYPDDYFIRGRDIRRYELKPIKRFPHILVHWVPIQALDSQIPERTCHNYVPLADGSCPKCMEESDTVLKVT